MHMKKFSCPPWRRERATLLTAVICCDFKMVHNYKRKTNRCSWSELDMERALEEAKKTSLAEASRQYGIPLGTLHRHLKTASAKKVLGRYKTVFIPEMEMEIVNYAKELDRKYYGLTKESLKELAFRLAERNRIPNNFRNGKAGRAWLEGFMKRHLELSFRTPEATSIARCLGFNKVQVAGFFDNVLETYNKYNLFEKPLDVYNVDETGVQSSASRPPKVISVKGKRQVGVISSAERGQLTTVVACCNAAGNFLPPCFVFGHRKRLGERMLDNAPAGCLGWCSDSGWINSDIFLKWLKFFVDSVRPSKDHLVLLILDNHVAHVNLPAIEYARDNGIIMLSIPPHTTHKLQPLDVSFFKSFKDGFEVAVDTYQKRHPGRRINQYDIPDLVKTAFVKSATISNASSGFSKSGIWPFNRHIFSDEDFAPASVQAEPVNVPTDYMSLNENSDVLPSSSVTTHANVATGSSRNSSAEDTVLAGPSNTDFIRSTSRNPTVHIRPQTSSAEGTVLPGPSNTDSNRPTPRSPTVHIRPQISSAEDAVLAGPSNTDSIRLTPRNVSLISTVLKDNVGLTTPNACRKSPVRRKLSFSPSDIWPLPETTAAKRKQRCQKSEILTSSPFKTQLLDKENENKRKCAPDSKKKSRRAGNMKLTLPGPPTDNPLPDENVTCIICSEEYSNSRSKEKWIQCNFCEKWAHEQCTDYNIKQTFYICDHCR